MASEPPAHPPSPGAPARDGNIAVQEEFEASERAGTVEAYRLFIARHPDHPLATVAHERLRALGAADTAGG